MSRNYLNSTDDAERDRDEGPAMQVMTPADTARRNAFVEQMMADHDAGPDDEDDTDDTLLGVAYPSTDDDTEE